jgi:7-cyano-7-deazaguanine synthase
MKAVGIISGGLDSTVLAYYLSKQLKAEELFLLSFDYGQKHVKELASAARIASGLKATHEIVNLQNITRLISNSALTSPTTAVPEGHYAAENMAATVVPNRNAIMLAIAYGWAVNVKADTVAIGVHAGDHPIYPDCRETFINSFDAMERLATEGYSNPNLVLTAPFVFKSKAEVVVIGNQLKVPFEQTWSCYVGGKDHCGRCGTCVERKEAFRLAKVPDPTRYEDPTFEIEVYRG